MSNGQVSMDTRLDLKTLEEKLKGKTLGLWMLSVTGTKQALIRWSQEMFHWICFSNIFKCESKNT